MLITPKIWGCKYSHFDGINKVFNNFYPFCAAYKYGTEGIGGAERKIIQ